jgi:hypothetical protein
MKTKSTIAILAAVLLGSTFAFADSGVPKTYPLKKIPRLRRGARRARQASESYFGRHQRVSVLQILREGLQQGAREVHQDGQRRGTKKVTANFV